MDQTQVAGVDASFATSIQTSQQPSSWLGETVPLLYEQGLSAAQLTSATVLSAAAQDITATTSSPAATPSGSDGFCEGDRRTNCIIVACSIVGGFVLIVIGVVLIRRKKKKTISLSSFLSATEEEQAPPKYVSSFSAASSSPYQVNQFIQNQHRFSASAPEEMKEQPQPYGNINNNNNHREFHHQQQELDEYIRGLEEDFSQGFDESYGNNNNNYNYDGEEGEQDVDEYFRSVAADDDGRQDQRSQPLSSYQGHHHGGGRYLDI
jgi:hypothetical protein